MNAQVGDELIIDGPDPGEPERTGTIIAMTDKEGPPYVVRWLAGYESVVFPGPDVRIRRRERQGLIAAVSPQQPTGSHTDTSAA